MPVDRVQARVRFWQAATIAAPVGVFATVILAVHLLGGYDHFQWVGKTVSLPEAIGVLGPLLLPALAYLYARQQYWMAMAEASRSWPIARGAVQTSEVVERRLLTGRRYKLSLTYAYEVAGMHYTGDRLAFAPDYLFEEDVVRAFARKYPSGATLDVRYDPDDPSFSVIETDSGYVA